VADPDAQFLNLSVAHAICQIAFVGIFVLSLQDLYLYSFAIQCCLLVKQTWYA